jgi:hypothetical protein
VDGAAKEVIFFHERKGGKYGMALNRNHLILRGSTKMGADHGL